MIKILKASLLTLSIMAFNYSQASTENISWAVLKFEKSIVTSYEVREFTKHMLISDNLHSHLFKNSENNIDLYKENLENIVQNNFLPTLKRMAFIRLVQQIALQQKSRLFFQLTKKQFSTIVEKEIATLLELQSRKELAPSSAMSGLVEDLKKMGFPHLQSESDEVIYQRWVKHFKYKMREEIREREALRFLCSLGDCDEKSPLQILKDKKRFLNTTFLQIRLNSETMLQDEEAFSWIFSDEFNFVTERSFGMNVGPSNGTREYILIGRIVDQKIEFMAINDWDITGQLERVGYPDTDDNGRTSGLMLNYSITGTKGSLAIELRNWLFSEALEPIDGNDRQQVEEEASLRITSRQFLDPQGNAWVVVGFSANKRVQEAAFHTMVQQAFHKLNHNSSPTISVPRNGEDYFIEGIIGVGGKYSILESSHVDILLKGEALLIPTMGNQDRNRLSLTSSLDLNLHGVRREYPFLYASLFGEYSFLTNGEKETIFGAKVGAGIIRKNIYYQANLFVIRWDSELDRRYEAGASWTTGVSLSVTFVNRSKKVDYEFN